MINLSPETHPIIWAFGPAASNAVADTCDWVCLKNAKGCMITIIEIGNTSSDLVLAHIHQGIVNGTQGTIPYLTTGQEFPLWYNLLTTTTDAMIRAAADVLTYDIAKSAIAKIVQVYIPSARLTNGYSWIQPGFSGGDAANIAVVFYLLDGERFEQATPPTGIA